MEKRAFTLICRTTSIFLASSKLLPNSNQAFHNHRVAALWQIIPSPFLGREHVSSHITISYAKITRECPLHPSPDPSQPTFLFPASPKKNFNRFPAFQRHPEPIPLSSSPLPELKSPNGARDLGCWSMLGDRGKSFPFLCPAALFDESSSAKAAMRAVF